MAESFANYSCAIGLCCELMTGVNREIDLCPNWVVCSELTAGFKVQFRAPKCQLPYTLRADGALVVGWLEPEYPEVCQQAVSGQWAAAMLLKGNTVETPMYSILPKLEQPSHQATSCFPLTTNSKILVEKKPSQKGSTGCSERTW